MNFLPALDRIDRQSSSVQLPVAVEPALLVLAGSVFLFAELSFSALVEPSFEVLAALAPAALAFLFLAATFWAFETPVLLVFVSVAV